jgi:ribosome biogenesis GTPase
MTPARRRVAELDESDVRSRPRRSTRPRTKIRPAHDAAVTGLVRAVDRGRYTCLVPAPEGGAPHRDERQVVAVKARELGRQGVVVGDRVRLVGDVSGRRDSLARVVRVEPRRSVLRRTADDADPVERMIVANVDQLAVVCAVADPEPQPRLVDRCLVAAFDEGLHPLLVVTKTDLRPPDDLLARYAPLGVDWVALSRGVAPDQLRELLRDRSTVLVGPSGVGKSTLVNALVPGTRRSTGRVNAVTGRGRHTSASVVALRLPGGGWVVDTPGVRSFGLAHVDADHLVGAFPDLVAVAHDEDAGCPRGCTHAAAEPECALDVALAAGRLDPARVGSYRRLLATRERAAGD